VANAFSSHHGEQRNVVTNRSRIGTSLHVKKRVMPKLAIDTYVDYVTRLWRETNTDARKKVSSARAVAAVKNVEHLLTEGDEYEDSELQIHDIKDPEGIIARDKLLEGCKLMLNYMDKKVNDRNIRHAAAVTGHDAAQIPEEEEIAVENTTVDVIETINESSDDDKKMKPRPKKKKKTRSILFGAAMGGIVACWVYSGNYVFTGLFAAMTVLGQLEYYRMVMNAGIYPARRISVLGSSAMFLAALFIPNLHQICLPIFSLWAMVWFLTMRRKVSTISEIATTLTGMTYLGYIPSFWVRIRLIGGGKEPTKLAPLVKPMLEYFGRTASSLPSFVPKYIHLPITTGANFIFWTWLCIAFSDVGAYFAGVNFGRTKLGKISPAAGATSPNKTVEGVIGGCIVSAFLATLGAWVLNWPYWWATGPIHGLCLALLGLIGDLTASMLKRDAGLKDFGDLLPEHGGIMDRVDSYIFTAPYSWLVLTVVLPWLKYGRKYVFQG